MKLNRLKKEDYRKEKSKERNYEIPGILTIGAGRNLG